MNTRLYVGNLSFNTTADGVRTAFEQFGTVSDVHLVTDRETGRARGFAFVTMGSPDEAAKAIQGMDGKTLDGRSLRVNEAEERQQRGGRGGGGGGGFGGAARLPGSLLPFTAINNLFNTVLGPLTQNGIDMPPSKAEIDTWESGCNEFTATANGWKAMLSTDVVGFNSLLTNNKFTPLKLTPTAVAVPASCKFVWPAATTRRR